MYAYTFQSYNDTFIFDEEEKEIWRAAHDLPESSTTDRIWQLYVSSWLTEVRGEKVGVKLPRFVLLHQGKPFRLLDRMGRWLCSGYYLGFGDHTFQEPLSEFGQQATCIQFKTPEGTWKEPEKAANYAC